MKYDDFLSQKQKLVEDSGFDIDIDDLPENLYQYQKDLVRWSCKRGKSALFTMTGTGKTAMQVTWADEVYYKTKGNVLILAPLAVSKQTVKEAKKFGISVNICKTSADIKPGLNITNYEKIHHFNSKDFVGIVLDESGIIKSHSGKTRNLLLEFATKIPYRLACTATPSPNDYMEIGNHAEFLGVMSFTEMLATFFVHDGGETAKWRLKGHAKEPFWKWLSSWCMFLTKPSDLGYSDEGFELPGLYTKQHIVASKAPDGEFFAMEVKGLSERITARRESINERVTRCIEIVKSHPKPFLVWCNLNSESEMLKKLIPGSVEVKGSDSDEHKEKSMLDFADGKIDVLISKPSICGFGMNFQVCSNTAFVGLSDSFESLFQATKRFHRHGQKNDVTRHLIISEAEGSVLKNIMRKEKEFEMMVANMILHTKKLNIESIKSSRNEKIEYKADKEMIIPKWLIQGGY